MGGQARMKVPLTPRELRLVIGWREAAGSLFPDEERVLRKLRQSLAAAATPELSPLQLRIALGWVEEQVGGRRGGGEVANPDEAAVLAKMRAALDVSP